MAALVAKECFPAKSERILSAVVAVLGECGSEPRLQGQRTPLILFLNDRGVAEQYQSLTIVLLES